MQCNQDCFQCPYHDCIYEQLTLEDVIRQDEFDNEIILEELRQRAVSNNTLKFFNYNHSDKGRLARHRYETSLKGRERKKIYKAKEEVKERNKIQCRAYYETHKEEICAKKKKQREQKRKLRERQKRYREKKKLEKLRLEVSDIE